LILRYFIAFIRLLPQYVFADDGRDAVAITAASWLATPAAHYCAAELEF